MGKVASPSTTSSLALLVPIVPINDLINVVGIRNKGYVGTQMRIYARKGMKRLGIVIGTRRTYAGKVG